MLSNNYVISSLNYILKKQLVRLFIIKGALKFPKFLICMRKHETPIIGKDYIPKLPLQSLLFGHIRGI